MLLFAPSNQAAVFCPRSNEFLYALDNGMRADAPELVQYKRGCAKYSQPYSLGEIFWRQFAGGKGQQYSASKQSEEEDARRADGPWRKKLTFDKCAGRVNFTDLAIYDASVQ